LDVPKDSGWNVIWKYWNLKPTSNSTIIDISDNGEVAVTGVHGGDEGGFVFISEAIGFAAALDRDGGVVWQKDYDLIDETILKPGDYTKVKPGLYHQFECIESGVAFELYWAEFDHNDIKRKSVGQHVNK